MKTEELIEGYLVYTDKGIERVHWCEVNGVKELVSPKGKVYGYVPDYFDFKRLQEQLNEANEVIKGYSKLESLMNCALGKCEKSPAQDYLKKWKV